MTDRNKGKYTRKGLFRDEFLTAQQRLAPLGGQVTPGVNDYEAFIYEAPGIRLIFYPHRTTAGNYHIRVRKGGVCDRKKLREAIIALAENSCTFSFPTERALHHEGVMASLERDRAVLHARALQARAQP